MARIPAFQAGRVGSIPITRSKREVVPLGMTSLFLFWWESNKEGAIFDCGRKQFGELFCRRGNERMRGDRRVAPENSHHPLQKRSCTFSMTSLFCFLNVIV